jgi:hypothetical protein
VGEPEESKFINETSGRQSRFFFLLSFGGSAASFSGNYGFYAETKDLVASEQRKCRFHAEFSHLAKRGPKRKLSPDFREIGREMNWLLLAK